MGSQWGYDRTHIRAKHEGYRSRAAYKLLEIQQKFMVIRPEDNIVDLGAAPGSWLQVERSLTRAKVVGIDLNPIAALDGVETLEGDLNLVECVVDPGSCKRFAGCVTQQVWCEVSRAVSETLEGITLADLAQRHHQRSESMASYTI